MRRVKEKEKKTLWISNGFIYSKKWIIYVVFVDAANWKLTHF